LQLPRVVDIDTIISQVQELEQRLAGSEFPENAGYARRQEIGEQTSSLDYPQVESEESVEILTAVDSKADRWQRLRSNIRREKPALAASLERVSFKETSPGCLELDFNGHEFDYEMVREQENFTLLKNVTRDILGEQVKISLTVGGRQEKRERRATTDRQRQLQQKALKHPLVTEALEIFGGEIVEVRVGPEKDN
jgi:hypothetical protein